MRSIRNWGRAWIGLALGALLLLAAPALAGAPKVVFFEEFGATW